MLTVNYKTSTKISIDLKKESFTDLIGKIEEERDNIGKKIFQKTVAVIQEKILERYLGKRYSKKKRKKHKLKIPWECPSCKNRELFRRRGKRAKKRQLITSLGKVSFGLYNVECQSCGKVFSPFPKMFDMKDRVRILDEVLEKMIYVVTENGYLTSKVITKLFTKIDISEKTLHKKVQEKAKELQFERSNNAKVTIIDGTKVNTGKTKRGESINLVMEIEGRCGTTKRPGLQMRIIDVQVGKQKSLKGKINTNRVICDGEMGQKKLVKEANSEAVIYRCHWHIGRTIGHYLYLDGNKNKMKRQKIIDFIKKDLIYGKETNVIQKIRMKTFEKILRTQGNIRTAAYLRRGRDDIFRFRTDYFTLNGKILLSQSPLERVMREVNRRADIGARWSSNGIEAITKLRLARLYNNKSYKKLWSQHDTPMLSTQM